MTQTKLPLTPYQKHHIQNFGKIDGFLKSVLNILLLDNLIVGWVEGVMKKGVIRELCWSLLFQQKIRLIKRELSGQGGGCNKKR